MPLQLFEDLAVVIQTGRSANIFLIGMDDDHWHDQGVWFFCSQFLGHPLHDGRFPHPSCPKDGQDRVPPVPRNASHQVLIHFFQTRVPDFKVDEGVQAGLKNGIF